MRNRRVHNFAPVSKGDSGCGVRQQDVGVRDYVSAFDEHSGAACDGRLQPNEGRRDDLIDFREGIWEQAVVLGSVVAWGEVSRSARVWAPAAVWQLAAVLPSAVEWAWPQDHRTLTPRQKRRPQ